MTIDAPPPAKDAPVLTEDEKALMIRLFGLFAKPDEGVSMTHAERMAAMPTVDEWVAGLPDHA